jgi:hypothetical protein
MVSNQAESLRMDLKDDEYITVVLDCLDREMLAARPSQTSTDRSDELDLLVADLMKQLAAP